MKYLASFILTGALISGFAGTDLKESIPSHYREVSDTVVNEHPDRCHIIVETYWAYGNGPLNEPIYVQASDHDPQQFKSGKFTLDYAAGDKIHIRISSDYTESLYIRNVELTGGREWKIKVYLAEVMEEVEKPVIYLYPEQTEQVHLEVAAAGGIGILLSRI